jgi:hypothetical protein
VEGALVHAVETGLITIEKVELVAGGELGEGGGDTGAVSGLGAFFHALVEQGGFDGPETAQAPGGRGHFLDDALFDVVGGIQLLQMLIQVLSEGFLRFVPEHHTFGQETVTDRVGGRAALPRLRFRTARQGSVCA